MRALKRGLARVYRDHRSRNGKRYRTFCDAVERRLGRLPVDALPTLSEAAWLAGELEQLKLDHDDARQRRRLTDARRIRRQMVPMRTQYERCMQRLEELAKANRHTETFDAALRRAGRAQ